MAYRHLFVAGLAIAASLAGLNTNQVARAQPIISTSPPTDWPRWRGPQADGVAIDRELPLEWSETKNVRWVRKLPGWGTSSPVVRGSRIFITSQEEVDGRKTLWTLALDRDSGEVLWRDTRPIGTDQRTHEKSNLAVNTPATTDEAVFVAFGNAAILRYRLDGAFQWQTRYLGTFEDPKMAWGYSISPLVLDDSILFPWDHHTGPCLLIGLDPRSGEFAWKQPRPIGTAHATPLLVELGEEKLILVPGKNKLTAFDARTRRQLWQYGEGEGPYNGEIISSPVHHAGVVYLQLWRQSPIHAIRLQPHGRPPEPLWIGAKPGPVEPSLLYYRDHVYAWMDNGVLTCLDARTGAEVYRERLGGAANSSPVACAGRIYVSNNDGQTFVVAAGREFRLLATNELGERITASPAISGHSLILRTDTRLFRIESPGVP